MKYLKPSLIALLFFVSAGTYAQSIFTNLTVVQFGDSILVNWTLKGGYTCTNMELQRSIDNVQFTEIYLVAGTCGATSDQYYDYVDSEDLDNGYMYYYRVVASAGTFVSETASVLFVNAGEDEIFIYPNPSDESFNVTVDNDFIPPFLLEIFTAEGRQINSSSMIFANNFVISKGILPDGVYILKITTEDRQVFNKSIVIGK